MATRTTKAGEAAHPSAPIVEKLRMRYAKRGRARFSSHRDIARTMEWTLRRAGVPVALSHGFSPHPRLSWIGAAPTGAASDAEYVEIGVTEHLDPLVVAREVDAVLPEGLSVIEVVPASPGALADRIDASHWEIETPGAQPRLDLENAAGVGGDHRLRPGGLDVARLAPQQAIGHLGCVRL